MAETAQSLEDLKDVTEGEGAALSWRQSQLNQRSTSMVALTAPDVVSLRLPAFG